MTKQARFLILRGGAIGDFILTLPALQSLRDRWPDALIEVVGYPHIANLAVAAGLVDRVESLDRAEMAKFFSWMTIFTDQQAEYIKSFDLVISYLHDPSGVVKANLLAAGAKQVIYGSPLVDTGHAIDHLLKPLETLAIYNEGVNPKLALGGTERARGREWLAERGLGERAVAIHPGSGSPKKNWPVERFVDVARGVGEAFFILGEADRAISDALRHEAADIPALSGGSLIDVAAVLSVSRAYVGNDSGITHIAAALGIPVVALFGPSDPDRWGPRGSNVTILRAPEGDLERLSVADVLARLQ
jgi:heptosyltransferase III